MSADSNEPGRRPNSARSSRARGTVAAWARGLGYAGLIPLVVGASAIWLAGDSSSAGFWGQVVLAYGAVILSFVGAVLWGVVVARSETAQVRPVGLVISVIPALLGWLSLLTGPTLGCGLQVATFLGLHACERWQLWCPSLPSWYLALRARLTVLVASTLVVAGCGLVLG